MTPVNVQQKDFHGQAGIEREHIENNSAMRGMLLDRGIRPETLLPAEDVKEWALKDMDADLPLILRFVLKHALNLYRTIEF